MKYGWGCEEEKEWCAQWAGEANGTAGPELHVPKRGGGC